MILIISNFINNWYLSQAFSHSKWSKYWSVSEHCALYNTHAELTNFVLRNMLYAVRNLHLHIGIQIKQSNFDFFSTTYSFSIEKIFHSSKKMFKYLVCIDFEATCWPGRNWSKENSEIIGNFQKNFILFFRIFGKSKFL